MCESLSLRTMRDGFESAISVGRKTVQGAVAVTANMCKEVGNLRAVAGMISAIVKMMGINNLPVAAFGVIPQTCDNFNKAMGGIHVAQRANEFANGSAFTNAARFISRVAFIVRDVLSCMEFLESQALIAAGTASKVAFKVFGTSAQSIIPTLDYVGWGADLSLHVHDVMNRGLSWETGFALGTDATKLIAISLTGAAGYWLQMIRYAAIIGTGSIVFGKVIRNTINQ